MKRWLALRRWRLLWLLVGASGFRIILAIAVRLAGIQETIPEIARLIAAAGFDLALLALAVIVLTAFVQHGRIYSPRIPTE